LPDGKRFLFAAVPVGPDNKFGLCVGDVNGGPTREIGRIDNGIAWAGHGYLVTGRNGALVAWRFDERALKLVGDPVGIGDALVQTSFSGGPIASAAMDGTLAYLTREDIPVRAEWYDLAKQQTIGVTPLAPGFYESVSLGPDDRRAIMAHGTDPAHADLVIVD